MAKENTKQDPRLAREKQTVASMIGIYCRRHHGRRQLCDECENLLQYALGRLDHCPFAGDKPTCARCTVHCYGPTRRARIREVMRYAGPRMLLWHPILAVRHQFDRLRRRTKRL